MFLRSRSVIFIFFSHSHRRNFENLNYEEWVQEQIGMREMLQASFNIWKCDQVATVNPHLSIELCECLQRWYFRYEGSTFKTWIQYAIWGTKKEWNKLWNDDSTHHSDFRFWLTMVMCGIRPLLSHQSKFQFGHIL